MDERFTSAELLNSEALAQILVDRGRTEQMHLEKLGKALRSRGYDVYFFIRFYGPTTQKDMEKLCDDNGKSVFPRTTLRRALLDLEIAGVIKKKGTQYWFQK